jgi:hypothetical protein
LESALFDLVQHALGRKFVAHTHILG